MAIVSSEKGLCFIHIPRTGGATIKEVLKKQIFDIKTLNPLHSSIGYALAKNPEIKDYIKFSYVRNPYDLLISIYTNIIESENNSDYVFIKDIGFYGFVEWIYEVGMKREENDLIPFYRTQTDMLFVNNKPLMDEVYKFETLCNDSNTSSVFSLFYKLNLPYPNRIPLLNSSKRTLSSFDLFDFKTYSLVNKIFKTDFKNFRYKTYGH